MLYEVITTHNEKRQGAAHPAGVGVDVPSVARNGEHAVEGGARPLADVGGDSDLRAEGLQAVEHIFESYNFV